MSSCNQWGFITFTLLLLLFTCAQGQAVGGCTQGSESLFKQAFIRAQMNLFSATTPPTYLSLQPQTATQLGFLIPSDCIAIASNYPWPLVAGDLAAILARGSVLMGTPTDPTVHEPEQYSVVKQIITAIGLNYGVNLTLNFILTGSSDAAFDNLTTGVVDFIGPNFSPVGFVGTVPRKSLADYPCSLFDGQGVIYVNPNFTRHLGSNFTSFSDVQTYLNAHTNIQVVADAAGSQATAQALFPANTIFLNSDLTQIASMYNSGVYNFLWDVKNIPLSDFVEAPFQYAATVSEPTGVFFRFNAVTQASPASQLRPGGIRCVLDYLF